MLGSVFLSHTTADDSFVEELRLRLQRRGYEVIADSTWFRAGDNLPESVQKAIDGADHVVGVVSAHSVESGWVKRELRYAQKLAIKKQKPRIIPLLLPNATTEDVRDIFSLPQVDEDETDLENWPAEPLAIDVNDGPGAMDTLVVRLVDALQGRLDVASVVPESVRRISDLADLVLALRNPRFEDVEGADGVKGRRAVAEAQLSFYPPNAAGAAVASPEFTFIAPLGKLEASDLSYYLERYHITPFGVFADRARDIEEHLPEWGETLWFALEPERPGHADAFRAWKRMAVTAQRRFTVEVRPLPRLSRRATDEEKKAHARTAEAATELLALPWELVHDGIGYLFHDGIGVRVRRSLPGGDDPPELPEEMRKPPLRVLIVCARPESDGVRYIDHRVSVRPLIEALNTLGELARYDIVAPPTFSALKAKLREALAHGEPYHIVHFDGHGVYDRHHGLGGLVFEDAASAAAGTLTSRGHEVVTADRLGAELRNAGVELFFLEACETARTEEKPEASVAGKLLQSGIASVAAMSHSVLVETARRFTSVFYPALVRGERVGAAMLAGQRNLFDDRHRGWAWGPGAAGSGRVDRRPLELQDWFVPVLYQDGTDPVVLTETPPAARVQEELQKDREFDLGEIPPPPEHAFVGRSRELLAAERLLIEQGKRYVVLRGEGGEGKTTIAAELARWLVSTRRMDRGAFASVENTSGAKATIWAWGAQLVPNFASRAGESIQSAELLLLQALRERDTVLILDNVESILPPPPDSEAAAARVFDHAILDDILALCRRLLEQARNTRLVFTSREPLPEGSGFDDTLHALAIGRLSEREGMELVARVLAQAGSRSGAVSAEALQAQRDEEIKALVDAVAGHARSLVLLTPELALRGLRATTEELREIMATLERRHPGERERSLFASVELSLRRLPAEVRRLLPPLGVFQGGGNVQSVGLMLGLDLKNGEHVKLAILLREVGLVEITPPEKLPCLRFDPALGPALLRELMERDDPERTAEGRARARWADLYHQLAIFLSDNQHSDAHLAAHLTLQESPNLLASLRLYSDLLEGKVPPLPRLNIERSAGLVLSFARRLEILLQFMGRRGASNEVAAIRSRAQAIHQTTAGGRMTLDGINAAIQQVETLMYTGRANESVPIAQAIVDALAATPDLSSFPPTTLGHADVTLGRALLRSGNAEAALMLLDRARELFTRVAQTHPEYLTEAERMASLCLTEEGTALRHLGRLEAAGAKYEEAIERDLKRGDIRDVAAGKGQLGSVRLEQRRYAEAIDAFREAMRTFESLGEPRSVSVAWHQMGIAFQESGDLEQAESAYQRSLTIKIHSGDLVGEASTRLQLGTLYAETGGRLEEAVLFSREAAEIYGRPDLADRLREGRARGNAANYLVQLGRHQEARTEVLRSLECLSDHGRDAQMWKTWWILHLVERAAGNSRAAMDARQQAMAAYERARRHGWEITAGAAVELCETVMFIVVARQPQFAADFPDEARIMLPEVERNFREKLQSVANRSDAPAYMKPLAPKLLAILDGSRDPALAEDPDLDYDDAVELKLLLERLAPA